MFNQLSSLMGGAMPSEGELMGKFDQTREVINKVNAIFTDPTKSTFVCVCIPEFLSMYETERLVQELGKFNINVRNIVINQVLFPDAGTSCNRCDARQKMQQKYIDQIYDLYEDFHIIEMPLLDEEVRGTESLKKFSALLMQEKRMN